MTGGGFGPPVPLNPHALAADLWSVRARRSLTAALIAVLGVVGAPAVAAAAEPVLFVQQADRGELTPLRKDLYRLRLEGVSPSVATFASQTQPAAGEETLRAFIRRWEVRNFDQEPPTAALVVKAATVRDDVVFLSLVGSPRASGDGLTFDARPVDGYPGGPLGPLASRDDGVREQRFGPASLYVENAAAVPPEPGGGGGVREFIDSWSGAVGVLFMFVIVVFLWRSLKMVPRTAPQTIKPAERASVTWEEIAGADEAKEELMEVVQFLRDPKRFRRFGATMPKGVLLHGPPGTGKTLLAKAVAHESGAHFFSQSAAAFVEMFAGLGAARIRRLFAEARKHSPAIIFIDELDAVGGRRGEGVENSEREQTLNQLLVEMDGFAAAEDIVVMAASNLLDKLDPALLRPGRFDRQVFVAPPDVAGRQSILAVHTRTKPLHDVDLRTIAAQTSGLTGADLANLCNEAAIFCARREGAAITQADFDHALERVIAGVQSKRVLQPAEKRVVAYHEAGHALCAEMLASVDTVHKVSIVPRGKALGFTLNLPEEDRYLRTRDELLDHMAMLLGGRVAEQVVFGSITTGASDDLRRVSDLSYAMVHEYAMGTAEPAQAAQRALAEQHLASDVTRRIRDEEQRELAFQAQAMALRIVTEHRAQLDALAEALLEREVLERGQINEIMAGVRPFADRPAMTGTPTVEAALPQRPAP